MKSVIKRISLLLAVLFPSLLLVFTIWYYEKEIEKQAKAKFIIVSKQKMTLDVFDSLGKSIMSVPIACGKNFGDKAVKNDMKTPEGIFRVSEIADASGWSHDFKDGKGNIKGAYGNHFIRLLTPGHQGVGIHGTHDPKSIGTRVTEGCIRLNNNDVDKLAKLVDNYTVVIISPSEEDIIKGNKTTETRNNKKTEKTR